MKAKKLIPIHQKMVGKKMKITNVELYQNGENWVVAWKNNSSYYPHNSEAFPTKWQAKEFFDKLA